jgi:hypothetical protein
VVVVVEEKVEKVEEVVDHLVAVVADRLEVEVVQYLVVVVVVQVCGSVLCIVVDQQ